jgi:hypothetical protein
MKKLRSGDWVEVRSAEEILATLDDKGRLEALPFMPEMLQYCGKKFRVYKSAHKTCDTIEKPVNRRMNNAVHLEGLRCDGVAHGGCQAGCLLFWKKAWLKPVPGEGSRVEMRGGTRPAGNGFSAGTGEIRCDLEALDQATRAPAGMENQANEVRERYVCQATEMLRATTPLKWWDPRPYVIDLVSGNVRIRDFIRYIAIAAYNIVMRLRWPWRTYPSILGLAKDKTPAEVQNFQPGELVQVRSKAEIMQTINARQRNRGLWFDVEMVPFCGKTFRVLRRVEKIINDKTGAMLRMSNSCLILEGVVCGGCLSQNRLFCPRSIYPYWHEIWLKRVDEA